MTETQFRKSHECADAEELLRYLTAQQHLQPHRSVRQATEKLTTQFGACPVAIARSIDWLNLNPELAIGRLRRTELSQLANSIHRHWRAALDRAGCA